MTGIPLPEARKSGQGFFFRPETLRFRRTG